MSRRHALLLALLLPAASHARAGIAIDETQIRLTLDAERSELHVPVAHRGQSCTARLQVEVRPPSGAPRAQATATAALRPGANQVTVELPARLGAGVRVQQSDLLQDRIAYEASGCGTTLRGVRAVAQLTGQAFALRASVFEETPPDGRAATVTVLAHGHDGRPAAGVALTARVEESDAAPVRGVTGDDGRAVIQVAVGQPRGVHRIEVEGRRGALASTLQVPFVVGGALRARIMTSQPIYRPGQPLRARVLLLDARRAVRSDLPLSARLTSPSGEVVWHSKLAFSRHGIAPIAWDVPARAETGDYDLWVETAEGADAVAREAIVVERYELPGFRVDARAAEAFFLPGQPAAVDVRVERLTGEPLEAASVRLGDADGAQVRTDAEGRAHLPVDLAEQHESLEDGEPQFVDHDVLVTVTDPVSLRSEARKVTVRATRLPLHVYWWSGRWEESRLAPLEGYVSTQLADGTPIAADVTLSGALSTRVRTGPNGLARVSDAWQTPDSDALLLAVADAEGRTGHARTEAYSDDDAAVRLGAPRTLLRPGEPARVTVRAHPPGGVLVQFWHDGRLLDARALAAGAEPTTVELSPPDGLRGRLSVTALRDDGDEAETDAIALVYPDGRRLQAALSVQPARARPGDTVEATVALTDAAGRPVAGAVGVAGVDVAVLDRARTRSELDRGWQPPGEWLAEPEEDLVSRLSALDPAAPWSDEEQLAAEARLAREQRPILSVEEESGRSTHGPSEMVRQASAPLRKALLQVDWPEGFPRSLADVRAAARRAQLDADRLEDPWDNPFRVEWAIAADRIRVRAHSMGPDERAGTPDDASVDVEQWRWFAGRGERLAKALRAYLDRTDRLPLAAADLAPDLRAHGLGPDDLRDPWGRRLTLEPGHRANDAEVRVQSRGPSGSTPPWIAWTAKAEMFVRITAETRESVRRFAEERGRMPRDDAELRDAGVRVETLRDPWGHGIRARFRTESRYTDVRRADGTPRAVTQQTDVVDLIAAGPDGVAETADDVLLTTLRRVVGETGSLGEPSPRLKTEPVVSGTTGAIVGWVEDATGAAIPGVTVQASTLARTVESQTDADGAYALGGLEAGTYALRFELTGFVTQRIEGVQVRAGQRTSVDITLRVSTMQELVMVTAEAPEVDTSSTARSTNADRERTPVRRGPTPRLRTYFPDALLWRPEVETDEDGRARMSFPLPDSLTTWELAALASTADGLTAPARAQVVGALPFSAELAPPPVMTVGDVVQLPVPIRNDLDEPVEVRFTVERGAAFAGGPAEPESVTVPAGDVGLPAVELRAILPSREAALTASAVAPAHADRIRKTVTIRADGEPSAETRGEEITARRSTLAFRIPDQALPGSAWAELRILPDLRAHVAGAVTGAMARPWGCAEQTISAVFPSLLLLEMAAAGPHDAALATRARGFLEDGLERLQGYESASGLAYWSGRTMDPALTAYGLRFLARAQRVTEVPSARVDTLRDALLAAQAPDGSWTPPYSAGEGGTALTTAQVARALAQASPTPYPPRVAAAIARARTFLQPHLERIPEPYLLASWALAARAIGDAASDEAALARLRELERRERDGAFWDLQTNTPFYGWGTAGRLETTGLALQALARGDEALRARTVAFLLRGQDRYGVWWSSQATVNVLEGLVAAIGSAPAAAGEPGPVEVWRDGARVARLDWPAPGAAPPLVVPLGDDLRPGAHQVVLRGLPAGAAWAQIVTGHARPWTDPVAGASPALRFSVDHDASTTARGAWITTRVRAARVGHRGYGMLLAEVGLPPGADVDRHSLEDALGARALDRYEVQPDRVVLYLWPRAGGADFSFRWRPRFAMDAQSAPSELYDYYNPEEHVHLRPARFAVR